MNTTTGIGAQIDQERAGMRVFDRTFSEAVPRETRRLPLAPGTPLRALVQGATCSINEMGHITPFDRSLRFGGFVLKLSDDGNVKVDVYARGALRLKVEGLTLDTKMDAPVYAASATQFSTEADGAVMGQLLAVEDFTQSMVIVGFRRPDDARPLVPSGKVMDYGWKD